MRPWLKRLAPPVLADLYRSMLGGAAVRYKGPYIDWAEAQRCSGGYDSTAILDAVRTAAVKVKRGEAAFEQDSVAFPRLDLPFPLLALLLRAAGFCRGGLRVLDFGGSLGSTYFRCRDFLAAAVELRWAVVEQPAFVECGRKEFAGDRLNFYSSIADCVALESPNVALLSSSLPYVPDPYAILEQIKAAKIAHIVIDRTQFHAGERDLFFVQKVSPPIYRASYPCRVFGRHALTDSLSNGYGLVASFDVWEGPFQAGSTEIRYGGWAWTRSSGC